MVDYNFIDSFDSIAWANLHNLRVCGDRIPPRVDYLFIRNKKFVTDLPQRDQDMLGSLRIKHIFTTGLYDKEILGRVVDGHLGVMPKYGFSASTGLIALDFLCLLEPKEIVVVGMDLFEVGKGLFYFDMKDNLASSETNKALGAAVDKDKLITSFHEANKTLQYISHLVEVNNINFVFYTHNKWFANNLRKLNVQVHD